MAATGLHISISAETVTHFAGLAITNSMITSLITSVMLISLGVYSKSKYQPNNPIGFCNFLESILEFLFKLIESATGSTKKTVKFFPIIASFFFFITLNNWVGLLPGVGTIMIKEYTLESSSQKKADTAGYSIVSSVSAKEAQSQIIENSADENSLAVAEQKSAVDSHEQESSYKLIPIFRAGTADLNTTIALAITTQIIAQYFGFQYLGLGYLKKFLNFSNPINFFVGILELMGEFTKIISFAFRLFGNIFAGEVLLTVIAFLVPAVVPMPFYALEIFVGVIQGLVFAMLSLVFYNMATASHDTH